MFDPAATKPSWKVADSPLAWCAPGIWLHPREDDRLESLRSYGVLEAPTDPGLLDVTRLAAAVCDAPAAIVCFVDRQHQWFSATHGLAEQLIGTGRVDSICSDAVAKESNLILEDATAHPRYAQNALVIGEPHLRAYAGVPLIGRDGLPIGTLCALDWRPRTFSDQQIEFLEILADQVIARLELQRSDRAAGRAGELVLGDALDARRLRRGIEAGEFVTLFQTIVNMRTEAVIAVEALVRWNHPELGMVSPALFLPAMERTGLMIPLGRRVLESALDLASDLARLVISGPVPVVNVNISGSELRSPGLASAIEAALDERGLPATALCIEVTETMPLPGEPAVRELECIRDLGVAVSLDDYGSGTATLGQIATLPLSALKIDRELVLNAELSVRGLQILHSACALARELDLEYCAEGIETVAQRDLMLDSGIEHGQGWLFSTPLDASQLIVHVMDKGTASYTSPEITTSSSQGDSPGSNK